MIPAAVTGAFNTHLNREMYSSYFYLALSAYGESLGLRGIAKWFLVKHHEELAHAMKFYRYLVGQEAAVTWIPASAGMTRKGSCAFLRVHHF